MHAASHKTLTGCQHLEGFSFSHSFYKSAEWMLWHSARYPITSYLWVCFCSPALKLLFSQSQTSALKRTSVLLLLF